MSAPTDTAPDTYKPRHAWPTECGVERMVGSKADGERACRKCGTWRWFPIAGGVRL